MIVLKDIHIEHFMSIEELDLTFNENSLYAITGQNGSGKSSLLYALAFCLTAYRKGESYKDYVQIGYETATINLNAVFKGLPISYEVTLIGNMKTSKTPKRRVLYNSVEYINSDYNQFIKEYELEYLENLMFMFQGSNSIIEAKPSERANTLKKLFRFEFDDIVKELKEKQEENKTLNLENTAVLSELKSRTYETQPLFREVVEDTVNQWSERLTKVSEDLRKIENISTQDKNKYQQDLINLQNTINQTQKTISEDKIKEDTTIKSLGEAEEFLRRNKSLEDINLDISNLNKKIESHKNIYKELSEKITELEHKVNLKKYSLSEIEEQIKIGEKGVCHACGQPVDPSHVEKLKKNKKDVEKEIKSYKEEILKLNWDPEDVEGATLQKNLTSLTDLEHKVQFEQGSVEHLKERLKSIQEGFIEHNSYLQVLQEKMRDLKKKEKEFEDLENVIREKDQLTSEKQELEEKVNTAKENHLRNLERKTSNEQILRDQQENERRVQEISEKLNEIASNQSTLKTSVDIFENQFPAYLILQATQILEDYINLIVQKIFPNIRVKLSQQRSGVNFFYKVEEEDEDWLPVVMASGAQKQILALAYQISLARLYGLETICLDEVDASMSAENAEIIYEFITSLDNFKQIIFISHRKESIEIAKQTNPNTICYYVEKGKYSLVED